MDILKQIRANVDLDDNMLKTKSCSLALKFKPNLCSDKVIIPANSKKVIKIPVDVENGDIYIEETEINSFLTISEGIYHAKDWYSLVEVKNFSNTEKVLFLEQPIKAQTYDSSNFIEINHIDIMNAITQPQSLNQAEVHNFNISESNYPNNSKPDLSKLLRLDHLNSEEKKALLKLCKKFHKIFYHEDQDLTFTNEVKHKISTVDDIPIHTKSYRYPYIHKEEVKRQISKMLSQGIIRHSFSPWSSPVWIVPKKLDASGKQKWRLVIGYRKLN